MGQALEQAIAGNSTVSEKKPKDPNEKSLAEILKSCNDETQMIEKVLSRKDGLNHLLLTDTNKLMQKIADEYPQYAKMTSIGKSFEGRDINMLEITAPESASDKAATQSLSLAPIEGEQPAQKSSKKPAIFMTGATHARELISTSINMFKAVQLIQQGVINKDKTYENFLKDNKYYFVPILNVDGVALIEQGWEKDHKILPVRKNRDPVMAAGIDSKSLAQAPPETQGVDLNRNFGVQFGDSAGHPAFVEDNWIAKADQHKDEFRVDEMV
jgi:hypothetical protein